MADGTTPVVLADFHAAWTPEGVAIVWRIAGEPTDHAGFHVWRSVDDGPEIRITPELVTGGPEFTWIDRSPPSGAVSYWLVEISRSGVTTRYGPIALTLAGPAPALALQQNQPNPFRAKTAIRFQTPRPGRARLVVYDVAGRAVATVVDAELPAGVYEADWNARNDAGSRVAAGVYLYHLETVSGSRALKLTVLP